MGGPLGGGDTWVGASGFRGAMGTTRTLLFVTLKGFSGGMPQRLDLYSFPLKSITFWGDFEAVG